MRFGCMAHSINLILLNILKEHIAESVGFHAFKKLITHFNKSHESKKKLIEATDGLTLLKLCATRWAQWLLSLERFIKIKEHVRRIARSKNLAFPSEKEMEEFEAVVIFLKPITELLEAIQVF